MPQLPRYNATHTFGTVENIGDDCAIRRSCTFPGFDCGVTSDLAPKTLHGADIALDTEGHISVVAAAMLYVYLVSMNFPPVIHSGHPHRQRRNLESHGW
jgi:hypothetical protein